MATSPSLDDAEARAAGWLPRGLRVTMGLLLLLAIVVGGLYLALRSGAFVEWVVLPRLGAALNARVSAAESSLRAFSEIELRQLRIETVGPQPLFQAERVRLRSPFFGWLAGGWEFPELVVEAPRLDVVRQADGKTNLDPLLEAWRASRVVAQRRKPLKLDLGSVTVSEGTLRFSRLTADGRSYVTELGGIDLNLESLGAEKEGRLKLSASVAQTATAAAGQTNGQGRLRASLAGSFTAKLLKNLQPDSLQGELRLEVAQAEGSLQDLVGLVGRLGCDLSATEVRDLSARFERGGQPLGQVRIRGPLDMARSEARLSLEVASIDRNVLNLVAAPWGMDFADTKLNATTTLDVSQGRETLGVTGRGTITRLSLRQGASATPPLDLDLNYHFTLNQGESSAVVHKFTLTNQHAGRELLSATLDRPMYLAWGRLPQGINESDIRFVINDLRLGDWRMLLGTNVPFGTLNVTSKLTCQSDGRRVVIDFGGGVRDVVWELAGPLSGASAWSGPRRRLEPLVRHLAGQRFDRGELLFQGAGAFSDYRSLLIEKYTVRLSEEEVPLAAVSGSAGYDLSSRNVNLQIVVESGLPQLLAQFPLPQLQASAGRVSVDGLLGQEPGQRLATLNVSLSGVNATCEPFRFQDYDARVGLDAELTDLNLNLRRLQLSSRQGMGAFGGVDIAGKYDRVAEKGEFTLNIDNLSEGNLQPLLAPWLAPRQIAAVQISGSGRLAQDAAAGTLVSVQSELKGLRVHDPAGTIPNAPVDLQLLLEGSYSSNIVDLTQLTLALPTTPRTANRLEVSGRMALAPAHALTGQLQARSEGLELSGVLAAFVTNRTAAASARSSPSASAGSPAPERGPLRLPLQQFVADLKIDRIYAKDALISDWVATAKLSDNVLVVDPFRLTANGAPVVATARLDLGQPRFPYSLRVQTEKVPLGPWFDALAPEGRGQMRGDLDLNLQLAGSGLSGPGLSNTLTGSFEGGSTNLSLAIGDAPSAPLKSVINVVLGLPELARHPGRTPGDPLGQVTGPNRNEGGAWVDEITRAPLQSITARGKAANGRVELEQARVQSPAFLSEITGAIELAPVLTHSTLDLPVEVSVRRALAEQAGLLPASSPPEAAYFKLPQFLTLKGTWGAPTPQINAELLKTK